MTKHTAELIPLGDGTGDVLVRHTTTDDHGTTFTGGEIVGGHALADVIDRLHAEGFARVRRHGTTFSKGA